MAAYNFESKGLVDAILTPIAVCEAVEMNESIVVPKIFRSSNCMWELLRQALLIVVLSNLPWVLVFSGVGIAIVVEILGIPV